MTKAVFVSKVDPTYDDLPEERYHFPKSYLRAVEAARGDWIVYCEPRRSSGALSSRGGRQSYFGTARLVRIEPDRRLDEHFYAYVEEFLPFLGLDECELAGSRLPSGSQLRSSQRHRWQAT